MNIQCSTFSFYKCYLKFKLPLKMVCHCLWCKRTCGHTVQVQQYTVKPAISAKPETVEHVKSGLIARLLPMERQYPLEKQTIVKYSTIHQIAPVFCLRLFDLCTVQMLVSRVEEEVIPISYLLML